MNLWQETFSLPKACLEKISGWFPKLLPMPERRTLRQIFVRSMKEVNSDLSETSKRMLLTCTLFVLMLSCLLSGARAAAWRRAATA